MKAMLKWDVIGAVLADVKVDVVVHALMVVQGVALGAAPVHVKEDALVPVPILAPVVVEE